MRLVARHVRTVYIHSHEHKPVKSLEQHLDNHLPTGSHLKGSKEPLPVLLQIMWLQRPPE